MENISIGYCANCGIHLYGIVNKNGYYVHTNFSDNDNLFNKKCPYCQTERAIFCKECNAEIEDFSDPQFYSYCSGCGKKL